MRKSNINPMPDYFDRYIDLVEDLDIKEALKKYSPESIYHEIDKLTALNDLVYAPGKWTVKDILQHVIDNERIMAYRALRFSRNDATALPGYEESLLAANTLAGKRTVSDLLAELSLIRKTTELLFENMDEVMVLRSGKASQSNISVLALGFVIVGHALHHMSVIRERYFPLLD